MTPTPWMSGCREQDIEIGAPHSTNRVRRATQDGQQLRRSQRRWLPSNTSWPRCDGSEGSCVVGGPFTQTFLDFVQLPSSDLVLKRDLRGLGSWFNAGTETPNTQWRLVFDLAWRVDLLSLLCGRQFVGVPLSL